MTEPATQTIPEPTVSDAPPNPSWSKHFPVAPEGVGFIAFMSGAGALLAAVGPFIPSVGGTVVAAGVACLGLGIFSLFFFRDPERAVPSDPELVVSAADGRVTQVESDAERVKITVFLSVFNVHVNRIPAAGVVRECEYKPGEFLAAYKPAAELVNEQLVLRLETPRGRIEVAQIAGLIARRIICRVHPGDRLLRGDRYGLIRFGSCTVVTLPPGCTPLVKVGDRVRGAETPIARWGGGPGAA